MNKLNSSYSDDKYRIILDVNNAIISNLRLGDLFRNIAEKLKEILNFDVSAITLYDKDSDRLIMTEFGELMGSEKLAPGCDVPINDSHAGWVFLNKKPLVVNDLSLKKRFGFDKLMYKEGIISYVVTPLISPKNILGTLNLGSKSKDTFKNVDQEFVMLIARQIALAVDNANYFRELETLKNRIEEENIYLQEEIKLEHNFEEIVGQSQLIKKVLRQIELVAPTDSNVLVRGETGTGKELIARAIHNLSVRKDRPLIKINCPAIPSGLIESELFGHEKGAFTSALSTKAGKFELADGGTIFLDELGDLPHEAQAKLLRVLQEREFERVGGSRVMKTDVRIIAATNRDLEKAVEEGTFRSDLFFRLNVFPIEVPPLRDRVEDIPLLAKYFIQKYMNRTGKKIRVLNEKTIDTLKTYSWPGNIRELENIMERSVILTAGDNLQIPRNLFENKINLAKTHVSLEEMERNYIIEILNFTSWRIGGSKGAAKILGLHPNTLRSRMIKLGIEKSN